jgi:hypothetical protein
VARVIADGEVRIVAVVTISDTSSPTAGEIAAGTDITPYLASVDTPQEGNRVPSGDLSSAFRKTSPGKFGGDLTMDIHRGTVAGDDTAYDLFPRNTETHIVVRRFGGSDTAIIAADVVEVYPVKVISRSPHALEEESLQMVTVDMATTGEPDIDVAVAA